MSSKILARATPFTEKVLLTFVSLHRFSSSHRASDVKVICFSKIREVIISVAKVRSGSLSVRDSIKPNLKQKKAMWWLERGRECEHWREKVRRKSSVLRNTRAQFASSFDRATHLSINNKDN